MGNVGPRGDWDAFLFPVLNLKGGGGVLAVEGRWRSVPLVRSHVIERMGARTRRGNKNRRRSAATFARHAGMEDEPQGLKTGTKALCEEAWRNCNFLSETNL